MNSACKQEFNGAVFSHCFSFTFYLIDSCIHSFFHELSVNAQKHAFAPVHFDSKWCSMLGYNAHGNMSVKRVVFALQATRLKTNTQKENSFENCYTECFCSIDFSFFLRHFPLYLSQLARLVLVFVYSVHSRSFNRLSDVHFHDENVKLPGNKSI